MQRRSFIEMFVAGTAGFVGLPEVSDMNEPGDIWRRITKQYPKGKDGMLNFNNGSAGIVPTIVEKQAEKLMREMNRIAPYEALVSWKAINKKVKEKLSNQIGAEIDEIAIVRNTTEALNYVLRGISIPKNTKVICAKHDYGSAINILERLSEEKGFTLESIDLKMPATKEEIITSYKKVIKEDCSVVLLTAMTHREGQILPIKELTKIAKSKGAIVIVDAAHSIGHYEHDVKDWDCDYYCTSLHKWLSGPIGCGLLYMKKALINSIKGSYSADKNLDRSMSKFEVVGTKPFAIEASILSAVHFQEAIGFKNKEQRLKSLTDYWVTAMETVPRAKTFKPEEYGAISSFYCPGTSTDILKLLEAKKIHLKKVSSKSYGKNQVTRLRVSPNINHDFKDLDRLVDSIKSLLQ